MLLPAMAFAADLTWTCPELTATEDAYPWSTPRELGTREAMEIVLAAAYSAIPEECLAVCASWADGYCETLGCVTEAGDHVTWQYRRTDYSRPDEGEEGTDIVCTFAIAPVGLGWTSLTGTYTYSVDTLLSSSVDGYSEAVVAEATWVGTLRDEWPADRTIRAERTYYGSSTRDSWDAERSESWDDGACTWVARLEEDSLAYDAIWSVDVGAHRVDVVYDLEGCPYEPVGSLDGVSVGVVESADWTNALSDFDDDGVSAGSQDCDDTDPTINACAEDLYVDGVDQNCDGRDGDDGDIDGDGFLSDVYGGSDCNDRDADAYPDHPEDCDGIDNNCDGRIDESPDADGDQWTVCEGDCDDADPTRNPDAAEVCDGVDNDCNGSTDPYYDKDRDRYNGCGEDCDDTNPDVNPGAIEVVDGVDNDCNGLVDDVYTEDTGGGDSEPGAPQDTGRDAGQGADGGACGGCTTDGGAGASRWGVLGVLAWGVRRARGVAVGRSPPQRWAAPPDDGAAR